MNKSELMKLEDKAARVVMTSDSITIELWIDNSWSPTWFYYKDEDEYTACIIKIMQLIELKFTFEPFLIG